MSRSMGDSIAWSVGVSSEPEFTQTYLTTKDRFIVLGSDGLWEHMTNEEVIEIVGRLYMSNAIDRASDILISEATARWIKRSQNIDDISVIIVLFKREF